jgi:hypothetical protein
VARADADCPHRRWRTARDPRLSVSHGRKPPGSSMRYRNLIAMGISAERRSARSRRWAVNMDGMVRSTFAAGSRAPAVELTAARCRSKDRTVASATSDAAGHPHSAVHGLRGAPPARREPCFVRPATRSRREVFHPGGRGARRRGEGMQVLKRLVPANGLERSVARRFGFEGEVLHRSVAAEIHGPIPAVSKWARARFQTLDDGMIPWVLLRWRGTRDV